MFAGLGLRTRLGLQAMDVRNLILWCFLFRRRQQRCSVVVESDFAGGLFGFWSQVFGNFDSAMGVVFVYAKVSCCGIPPSWRPAPLLSVFNFASVNSIHLAICSDRSRAVSFARCRFSMIS